MFTIFRVLIFIVISSCTYGQAIVRDYVRLQGSYKMLVDEVRIIDDHILLTGVTSFEVDDPHYFFAKLDTNLNELAYVNLFDISPSFLRGDGDISPSTDGGYYVTLKSFSIGDYELLKFDSLLNLEYHKTIYSGGDRVFTLPNPVVETDSCLYVFGNYTDTLLNRFIYIDKLSLDGEYLSTKILDEAKIGAKIGGVFVKGDVIYMDYLVSDVESGQEFAYPSNLVRLSDQLEVDERLKYTGEATDLYVNIDGEVVFTQMFVDDPDVDVNRPRHLVRKLNSDFEEVWTYDYLYPPFAMLDPVGEIFPYNYAREIMRDPRGGYYVLGDVVGTANLFGYDNSLNVVQGISLMKIDEEGALEWSYLDSFNLMTPILTESVLKFDRLSSGNILVAALGLTFENGEYRENLSIIKTGPDACEIPGCRTVNTVDQSVKGIELFPNPLTDMLHVKYDELISSVRIFDLSSRLVLEQKSNLSKDKVIDVGDLPSGIYVVEVRAGGTLTRHKIVVQ